MRLHISAGNVPENINTIHAQAEGQESSVGRWFAAQLDIKALIAIGSVVVALGGYLVSSGRDNAVRQEQMRAQAAEIQSLKQSAAATVVPRSEYESTIHLLILLQQQRADLCDRGLTEERK